MNDVPHCQGRYRVIQSDYLAFLSSACKELRFWSVIEGHEEVISNLTSSKLGGLEDSFSEKGELFPLESGLHVAKMLLGVTGLLSWQLGVSLGGSLLN